MWSSTSRSPIFWLFSRLPISQIYRQTMSINLPNYGRSSSRQSTYQHHHNQHHAPQPPPQPFRVEAAASERRRRSEDAQPNLDEGKNLRPAHYVIGRKEPEPAPPQVLASASIRPSSSAIAASGRFQTSSNGAVAAAARSAAATYARANPTQSRPGPAVSNQVPTGPRSSSSIASGSGQAWPERGQRSSYTPSSAISTGYTGNSTGGKLRLQIYRCTCFNDECYPSPRKNTYICQ